MSVALIALSIVGWILVILMLLGAVAAGLTAEERQ